MPKTAAARRRRAAASTRPVPNLFLLAAAIRTEVLEGVRGGSAGWAAGMDTCVGMRPAVADTGGGRPEANSPWERLRAAANSSATWACAVLAFSDAVRRDAAGL